ncbi:MAG: phosphotransferase [Desulfovibrionaceae bacterium]
MLDPLEHWGLRRERRRPDLSIPGSPERCVSRTVLEDASGDLWLLEQLAVRQTKRREAIASVLEELTALGMDTVPAFQRTTQGSFSADILGLRWQLSPFILSDELPRPVYLDHAPRGKALAAFLTDFAQTSARLPLPMVEALEPKLNLAEYATRLFAAIREVEPEVHARLSPIVERLRPALVRLDTLPTALQHGDLHPLNVLWHGQNVAAVIDWEFLGVKPECYDLSNLLGCLGFEHPDSLTGPLARALTASLRKAGLYAQASWDMLPECTACQRLAWLSEWLRKGERDLLEMELEYMALLLDRAPALRHAWDNPENRDRTRGQNR